MAAALLFDGVVYDYVWWQQRWQFIIIGGGEFFVK